MFSSMEDVYDELIRAYDKAHSSSMTEKLGESLYSLCGFFCDYSRLVDMKAQILIKKYLYSKASNTPPYATIKDTPANFLEEWLIVDSEVSAINNSDSKASQTKVKKRKR